MARSHYIYLIRLKESDKLLAAFTVKHEADSWAVRHSGLPLDALQLSLMRDGLHVDKTEKVIPFTGQRVHPLGQPNSFYDRSQDSNPETMR